MIILDNFLKTNCLPPRLCLSCPTIPFLYSFLILSAIGVCIGNASKFIGTLRSTASFNNNTRQQSLLLVSFTIVIDHKRLAAVERLKGGKSGHGSLPLTVCH